MVQLHQPRRRRPGCRAGSRLIRPGLLLGGAVLAVLAAGCAQRPAPAADLLLWDVTVVDGTGAPPQPHQVIAIQGDRIAAVRPIGGQGPPAGVERLDLAGRWVLPGLIDTHSHFPPDSTKLVTRLGQLAAGGVTAVRDLAGDAALFAKVAPRSRDPGTPMARLYYSAFFAGPTWYAADKRPIGSTEDKAPGQVPWFLAVTDSTDLRAAVADAKGLGVSAIKIYSDLSLQLVQRIVKEAHDQGLLVWSHPAIFPVRPSDVVGAGVDVVSHAALLVWEGVPTLPARFHTDPYTNFGPIGPFDGVAPDDPAVAQVLTLMKARGTVLDATVSAVVQGISPGAADWACRVTVDARDLDIPVSAGTDGPELMRPDGLPPLFTELEYLVDHCGFTPTEAITAATLNGAKALGQAAALGSIERGKLADLVVVGADPTTDIRNAERIERVIKGGVALASPAAR